MHIHRHAFDLERANQMKVARGRAGGQDSHIGRQKANRQGRNVGVHDPRQVAQGRRERAQDATQRDGSLVVHRLRLVAVTSSQEERVHSRLGKNAHTPQDLHLDHSLGRHSWLPAIDARCAATRQSGRGLRGRRRRGSRRGQRYRRRQTARRQGRPCRNRRDSSQGDEARRNSGQRRREQGAKVNRGRRRRSRQRRRAGGRGRRGPRVGRGQGDVRARPLQGQPMALQRRRLGARSSRRRRSSRGRGRGRVASREATEATSRGTRGRGHEALSNLGRSAQSTSRLARLSRRNAWATSHRRNDGLPSSPGLAAALLLGAVALLRGRSRLRGRGTQCQRSGR